MSYKRQQKTKKMKGETLKIYRAPLKFYISTIIPMVRWSFIQAGFRLNPRNLLDSLTVVLSEVLDRIRMPEMALENYLFPEPTEGAVPPDRARHRRAPIPRPTEFAVSVNPYVDRLTSICSLCGHSEGHGEEKEAETI
jgi:hypothetical protein